MATFTINSATITGEPGTPGYNLLANDTLNVTATGTLISTTFAGIQAAGSNTINVAGDVIGGPQYGIFGTAGNYTMTIGNTGLVYGLQGGIFSVVGNNSITNHGEVAGTIGVILQGAGNNTVINTGQMSGTAGLVMVGDNNTVNNSGLIEGLTAGGIGAQVQATLFTNSGTVRGGTVGIFALGTTFTLNNSHDVIASGPAGYAFTGTAGIDTVNNTGTISSSGAAAVNFSAGNDVYNGAGGKAIGAVLGGDGDDKLTGGAFVDVLKGEANNDTLTGGGAADTLDGGDGNDKYMLNADASIDTILDANGTDTVFSTISRSIQTWGFIEHLTLQGASNINGVGNMLGNVINGNSGNNTLNGGVGIDTIIGGAGIDTINGGTENDVLKGGIGNDVLIGGTGTDNLYGDGNNDTFRFTAVNESVVGVGRDVIRDLDDAGLGDDVIDLSLMAGVSAFIGTAAFTAAGQVRAVQAGANVLVQINTVGNSVAESEILIADATLGNGVNQVGANDFLL